MKTHRRHLPSSRYLLGLVLGMALAPLCAGAASWPERPIKWVVPYVAGTSPDNAARILSDALGPILGQPIVIENRGGAAGKIGAQIAARAAPDGYTWVYSAAPMAANMLIYAQPGYDAIKDFDHVTRISESDVLLVVKSDSDIDSLEELIARARARPGALNYASGGVGTPSHLGMELFLNEAGIEATHVPYKGASEAVNAVLGDQVEFSMPIFGVAYPQVQAGRLKALAVANTRRNVRLPDVPTLAQEGVENVNLVSWGGVSLPAGTPEPIIKQVYGALHEALQNPKVTEALAALGSRISPSTREEYERNFENEIAVTETIMKRLDMAPQ